MKRLQMLLACEDEVYTERFLIYVNHYYPELPYEWHIFTEGSKLCAYLAGQKAALLLISESMAHGMLRFRENDRVWKAVDSCILLVDKAPGIQQAGWSMVSRYQSIPFLMKKIMKIYAATAKTEKKGNVEKGEMEMIGIYSPCGRCGKTSLALAMSEELSKEKSTLLLNMEWCSGFGKRFDRIYEQDLSDILCDIEEQRAHLSERLTALIVKNRDVSYVPPLRNQEDIWATDKEVWKELITLIREETGYEALICDFGQGVRGLYELLEMCDRVLVPVYPDALSKAKTEEFFLSLKNERWKNILEKIELVSQKKIEYS